jgi:glycosyltransferase involved in cell wall biosynthesis
LENPIKILVISNYTFFSSTRPEAAIFHGLKQKGVEVTIMTNGNCEHAENFRSAGMKVIDYMPDKKFSKAAVEKIRNEIISGNHQILLLYNSKAIINGIRAAKNLPVKVILYRGYTGNIHWWDLTAYMKYLHPRVDKIVCNSKGVEELLHRQLFFKKDKAITIHKGHDTAWYENTLPVDLTELNIPEGAFVATCVANARRMKGIKYLIKATYFIPTDYPIHLCLVGRGLQSKSIQQLVDNSPNKNKIHFTGFRPDGLRIVRASDVFVLASIKGESITKSVIEAMSLSVAPLITNIPGNRELVNHEQCGLIVSSKNPKALAEGIIRFYENPEERKRYAIAAKAQIHEHFNTKRTVEEYLSMFQSLLAGKS